MSVLCSRVAWWEQDCWLCVQKRPPGTAAAGQQGLPRIYWRGSHSGHTRIRQERNTLINIHHQWYTHIWSCTIYHIHMESQFLVLTTKRGNFIFWVRLQNNNHSHHYFLNNQSATILINRLTTWLKIQNKYHLQVTRAQNNATKCVSEIFTPSNKTCWTFHLMNIKCCHYWQYRCTFFGAIGEQLDRHMDSDVTKYTENTIIQ